MYAIENIKVLRSIQNNFIQKFDSFISALHFINKISNSYKKNLQRRDVRIPRLDNSFHKEILSFKLTRRRKWSKINIAKQRNLEAIKGKLLCCLKLRTPLLYNILPHTSRFWQVEYCFGFSQRPKRSSRNLLRNLAQRSAPIVTRDPLFVKDCCFSLMKQNFIIADNSICWFFSFKFKMK